LRPSFAAGTAGATRGGASRNSPVGAYVYDTEQQASCIRTVKEATLMRRLYLDGLWSKYLVPAAARMAAE
jgi:hypothetical protein